MLTVDETSRNPTVIRLPLNLIWFDRTVGLLKDVVRIFSFLFEPILDHKGLLDLSIGILVVERIGSSLLPLEEKFLPAIITSTSGNDLFLEVIREHEYLTNSMIFGSAPVVGLFGSIALIFSFMANSSINTSTLFPSWLNTHSGAIALYLIFILFCLEAFLIMAILAIACQNIYSDERSGLLIILLLFWAISLIGSNYARYHLYQQMGD